MRRLIGPFMAVIVGGILFCMISVIGVVSLIFVAGANACTAPPLSSQLPQATRSYLDKRNVEELAAQNQERYLFAQQATGVPWQIMAALHYREAGMNPGSSISNGSPLGSGVNVDGVDVVSDANDDAVEMANKFKNLAISVYDINVVQNTSEMTVDNWGEAFLAYNRGYLYSKNGVSYTQSPYVMNGFDADHMDMRWTYADTVSGTDGNKAGALAVLVYLGGVSLLNSPHPDGCVGTVVPPVNSETLYITSGAGMRTRSSGITKLHTGIDIIGGSEIVAMTSGTVVVAQNGYYGFGAAVKIDHGNGNYTLYAHMVTNSLEVKVGQNVIAGQKLGTMGNTGDSEGVHLHFQIWIANKLVNPYAYLAERGIEFRWTGDADPYNTTPGPL